MTNMWLAGISWSATASPSNRSQRADFIQVHALKRAAFAAWCPFYTRMVSQWKSDNFTLRCSFLSSLPLICTAPSIPALISWLSAAIFRFAVHAPLSASSPRRLMRSRSSPWVAATSDQGWTCCSQSAGCRRRMKARSVPIEKKWVMLGGREKKKKTTLPWVTMEGGEKHTFSGFNW